MEDERSMLKLKVIEVYLKNHQNDSSSLDIERLVSQAIPKLNVSTVMQVVKVIEDAGPIEPQDLLLLKEEDLSCVLKPLQRRKLLNFFKTQCDATPPPKDNCTSSSQAVDHVPTSDEPSQSVIPQVEAQALSQPELLFIPSPSEICEPVTTVPVITDSVSQSDDPILPFSKRQKLDDSDATQSSSGLSSEATFLLAKFELRLESIEQSLWTLTSSIDDLASRSQPCASSSDQIETSHHLLEGIFPLPDLDAFDIFEANLERDVAFRQAVEQKFKCIGGSNLRDAVRRILNTSLEHQLQLCFNWAGKRGWKAKEYEPAKRGISHTKFSQCIIKALLLNRSLEGTEASISHAIMLHLRYSSDRMGGRNRRKKIAEKPKKYIIQLKRISK